MQIFEFHFNPKEKKDTIFDSFCFEPATNFERRMGSLYMAGLLKNILPQHRHFLDNLAQTIKDKYYKTTLNKPSQSLRESLKRANEYLEGIAKRGDVSWLGNLGFSVLSIKNFELNFTKVGNFKIILLRKGQVIDIDQRLRFQEIEPYPLKVFGNIISGKLTENDILLVLTKELFDFIQAQKLLQELAQVSIPQPLAQTERETIDQKRIKDFFNERKEKLLPVSGLYLLIVLSKEAPSKEKAILSQNRIFSLKKAFQPLLRPFKVPEVALPFKKLKRPKLTIRPQIKLPSLRIKKPKKLLLPAPALDKRAVLILSFIIFLTIGFFIFEKREELKLQEYAAQLEQIEEKVEEAQTYLMVAESKPQAKEQANLLFQESLEDLTPLINIASNFPSSLANQIFDLKETISNNLYQLNSLLIVAEPELFFEFKPREFVPQKMVYSQEKIIFFSPYANNVFQLSQEGESELLSIEKNFDLAVSLSDSLLLFSQPDQIVKLQDNLFQEPITLSPPYSDFDFSDLASYQSNLYFFEKKAGQIIKYPYLDNNWGNPQSWLGTKKAFDFKSMAVDGSVWILTKDNSIEKYYGGYLQKTLSLEIFPEIKSLSKIFTFLDLPYLYLLEPSQKRIVLLKKTGEVFKQYQSEEFDNLLDFTVSSDGKTIYLLNGMKVYKIKL